MGLFASIAVLGVKPPERPGVFEAGERVVIPSSESHFECLCELTSLFELFVNICLMRV